MFESLVDAKAAITEVVTSLDSDVLDGASATELVSEFAAIERLAAAGKALCAKRVADSGAWRRDGDRSPARWMARTTGTSVGNALGVLETAERVGELPATETALRSGELSEVQAKEIVAAAAASPASEPELLAAVKAESVSELKERCARVKAAAGTAELDRYEAIRARRRLRHFRDPDGAWHLDAVLTPDAGAVVVAALEPYTERVFQTARRQGRRESHAAYAADALVEMAEHVRICDDEPSRRSPGATVHVVVDHQALLRGSLEDGETCEIPGVGPIPVATARALAGDAFLSALLTDGTDIKAVSHLGRTIPARLRTAVEMRDRTCVVSGCDVRRHLEIDHIRPRGDGGPMRLDNLARLCRWHHYLKTHRGYHLSGAPGSWCFERSDRARSQEIGSADMLDTSGAARSP
ncbi:MAG: HNH endonuclease [Actinomycetota bacterium]|nr:HNH endonuclease [Actinomycetota bacterium]